MFKPPYVAACNILAGTRRPKDTVMIKSVGGGVQDVNVSSWWS